MALSRLLVNNVRCIESAEISPCSGFNLFCGDNGAGKTSLLEAIHILSTGRSFRTRHFRDVLRYKQQSLVVSGTLQSENKSVQVGIQRSRDRIRVRIDQQPINQLAELSRVFPVIEFHPGSTQLITGDPGFRRAWLNWGVFQTNPEYFSCWRQYQHSLKQRNAALRAHARENEVRLWDKPMIEMAVRIHQAREEYLAQLENLLPDLLNQTEVAPDIAFSYRQGWKKGQAFEEVLQQNLQRDLALGYTHSGPHRADLSIFFNGHQAATSASRGETKFLTILLKLLQAHHCKQSSNKNTILLLDDLPSELDSDHLNYTFQLLGNLRTQVFLTAVDNASLSKVGKYETKLFHVKHGVVTV